MPREFNDESTEKTFVHPENPHPEAPIPIGPSLRVVWRDHQKDIEKRLDRFEAFLQARGAAPADMSPKSAATRVLRGAGWGGRALLGITGALGLATLIARALGREDVASPIEQFRQLFLP